MSKINKLSILGVRSFDNQRSETIQFQSPLTLIVGYNGSGKTTIIECLKYVTTGEMPPNSKGGAFIHDPKLCGEREVLAQVKVSFRSIKGEDMICTRNLSLTVKKNQRSMKTLEGNLVIKQHGDRHSISTRVAEISDLMPRALGVSKAILESVIFCHQDDSLWPLSEPAKLKQRFDEIFEALKYTKAIDHIKVLQKEQKVLLGTYKKDEDQSRVEKDRGARMQTQCHKLNEEIDALRVKASELGDDIKEAARKAEQSWQQASEVGTIVSQLVGKRIERQTKEESVQSLRENLSEMSDSDEELQRMLEQYEARVQHHEDDLKSSTDHYKKLTGQIQQARGQVSAKERDCGSHEAQKESFDRQVENREKLVKETARRHNIHGFNMEVDDNQVQVFMERITKMARDQNNAFERARRETSDELQRAQKVLNDINEKKSALNQRKESSRQTIAGNDRKIGSLQSELNRINIDEGGKTAMESSLRETNDRLRKVKSETASSDWDKQVESAEMEQRTLEERKEKLDTELVEGTRQAGDSARLEYLRKELKGREGSLATMTGAHGEKITSIVGQGWSPQSVESEFQRALDQASSLVSDAERQRDGTSREMEQLDFKLNTCRSDVKAKQQGMKAAVATIKQAVNCEPQDYHEEMQQLRGNRDIVKGDSESAKVLNEYFESCIKLARGSRGCKTCCRGFKNDKEVEKLVETIEKERKKHRLDEQDSPANDLKEAEEELQKATAVSSDYDTWERLKEKEMPMLQEQESTLSTKREGLISQLEEQDSVVSERQAAKRDVEAMSRTVQNLAKYQADITSFEEQIAELAAKQKSAGLGRGLEVIKEEMKKANDNARTVKARLAKVTADRERAQKMINTLELESRDIKSKLSTAEYQLKEKKSLEGQVEEVKALNNEQRESARTVEKELQDLGPQLLQAQVKYDDIARRGADKDRELQAEANKLNSSLNQLKMAEQEIKSYHERDGLALLRRAKQEVENCKAEVTRLEQEQGRLVREVKALEDQLRNHSETKRSIADNQRYRRDLRQLQRVRKEIEELEKHDAEEEKVRLDREGSKAQLLRNRIAAEQATIIGQLKSKDETLGQLAKDWETEYQGAAKKYKEFHIRVETTKACIEDLGRYGGALDKAIMKYHAQKMEEVNRIVDELWRKTYQGTDVDTILIRSENENVKSNKSYNYRVCMVKSDAEMDMRGRCSAGQKVLASIIIRLALAECFGVNCGLIALDEPTTNLDRDNIRALAESLSEIIKARRAQKNFQLIVITHDEEFLKYMGCSDHADNYWRVSRDASQKSIIEKNSIAEVCQAVNLFESIRADTKQVM